MSGPLNKWFKVPTLSERLRRLGVREDVIAAADRTAFGRQADRGLPDMAAMLSDAEGVIQLVEARYARATGLFVLTSRRLLFAPKATDRATPTTVELGDVQSVDWRMHRGLGVVELTIPSGKLVVDQILGNQAETLTASIRRAMNPPPDGPAAHRDPLDELAELRALHQAGMIGDAEFQARKQQLFGQI
jgi:Short C-terminal domain